MAEVDILGPLDRRRIWSAEEKATLLAEVDAEGGKVRLEAQRHEISESLLYDWRSARKAAAVAADTPEDVQFVPIGVLEGKAQPGPALLAPPTTPAQEPPPSRRPRGERGRAQSGGAPSKGGLARRRTAPARAPAFT